MNCYALISGYVGVYSNYRISNLASLWCRVAFYTILVTFVFKMISPDAIDSKTVISAFFPIFSRQYWYFTAYALMFLFVPILNEGINRLSKKKLGIILIAIVIATSIVQPFLNCFYNDVFGLQSGLSTWWLMILYLIGGYIRKYGFWQNIKSHRTLFFLFMYLCFVGVTMLSIIIIVFVIRKFFGESINSEIFLCYNSITILGAAISLLLAFENIKLHSTFIRVVAFISPLCFSVYLIHDQKLIQKYIIGDRFSWVAGLPVYYMIPLMIGIVIGIFLLCILFDLVRFYLFKAIKIKEKLFQLETTMKGKIIAKK